MDFSPEFSQIVARYEEIVNDCISTKNTRMLEQQINYVLINYSFRIIPGYGNWSDILVPILYRGICAIRG